MMTLDTPRTADELIAQANAALERRDSATMRECLGAALQLRPDDAELALALGHVKLHAGDYAEALADYTTVTRLRPRSAAAHSGRALALRLLGHALAAEQAAQQALSIDGHELVALKVLARVGLDAQRFAEVRQICQRILDRHPQDADAREFLTRCPSEPGGFSFRSVPPSLPAASEKLQSLEQLVGDYTARAQACRAFGPEHLLQLLTVGDYQSPVAIHARPAPAPQAADGFPVPPVALTMGYGAGDLDHYLACGRRSYEVLSGLLAAQHVRLEAGEAMLDWGCAAGRALRNFSAEAQRGCQVWGCDVHAPAIAWAQQHLAPPFHFFNSSSLPHLPMPDGTFKFIYGLSVMTHLVTMRDLWLLELRRVLRPDGIVILTVHDENTWAWFRERGWPGWMPPELRVHDTLPGESVDIRGSSWEHCYTFFHTDHIRRVWGQFFTVTDIVPRADCYQSAVILRKT